MLKAVSDARAPESFSRASQYRARKSEASTPTPYGTVDKELKLEIDGVEDTIALPRPFAFLW